MSERRADVGRDDVPGDKAPAWLLNECAIAKWALGDWDDWDLRVRVRDEIHLPGFDPGPGNRVDACCDCEPTYRRATLSFLRDLRPGIEATATVFHEMLHLATHRSNRAHGQIINGLVPDHLREHAERLWTDGYEPDVEALARSLAWLFHPEGILRKASVKRLKQMDVWFEDKA